MNYDEMCTTKDILKKRKEKKNCKNLPNEEKKSKLHQNTENEMVLDSWAAIIMTVREQNTWILPIDNFQEIILCPVKKIWE